MINILNAEKQINHYLSKTAKNYNLQNREIARRAQISEVSISKYINNNETPYSKTRKKLWNCLHEIWQAGIIRLPPNDFWNDVYYLPVADIKNPFETWFDCGYHGSEPEEFEKVMKEWEEKGIFEIINLYDSYNDYLKKRNLDGIRYNIIRERIRTKTIDNYSLVDFFEDQQIIEDMEAGLI